MIQLEVTAALVDLLPKSMHDKGWIIALDPGGTTGVAALSPSKGLGPPKIIIDQIRTTKSSICQLFGDFFTFNYVVCEDYKIYPSKLKEHIMSGVPTIHYIGWIELLCYQNEIPLKFQMSHLVKGFFNDKRMKELGCFVVGQPHATDALRHLLYSIVFSQKGGQVNGSRVSGSNSLKMPEMRRNAPLSRHR